MYPGYGGFLPWFTSWQSKLVPAQTWNKILPSLDNGLYFWSIYHVYNSLRDYSSDVATPRILG